MSESLAQGDLAVHVAGKVRCTHGTSRRPILIANINNKSDLIKEIVLSKRKLISKIWLAKHGDLFLNSRIQSLCSRAQNHT